MSKEEKRSRLLSRVGRELGRELTTKSLFLHSLIASKVGLNVTDTRCLEILSQNASEPMTAGALKSATGLTTGAVTGILDRLETAGYVRRVRDAGDRRKVFVELVPGAGPQLAAFYEAVGSEMEKLASGYSTRDLTIIEGFLQENLEILTRQIKRLSSL